MWIDSLDTLRSVAQRTMDLLRAASVDPSPGKPSFDDTHDDALCSAWRLVCLKAVDLTEAVLRWLAGNRCHHCEMVRRCFGRH